MVEKEEMRMSIEDIIDGAVGIATFFDWYWNIWEKIFGTRFVLVGSVVVVPLFILWLPVGVCILCFVACVLVPIYFIEKILSFVVDIFEGWIHWRRVWKKCKTSAKEKWWLK